MYGWPELSGIYLGLYLSLGVLVLLFRDGVFRVISTLNIFTSLLSFTFDRSLATLYPSSLVLGWASGVPGSGPLLDRAGTYLCEPGRV